jgi:hypothetical protein
VIPARTISGINYKTLVRVALGLSTGSFRDANQGVTSVKATHENRLVETFIIEARIEADRAVADRFEDGAARYLAMEAEAQLEGEMQGLATQFYYGRTNNAKGYVGLLGSYDATNMDVDATGSTASTGSSVWFVRAGPKDVTWVWGNGGSMSFSQPKIETLIDPNDSTKRFSGYTSQLLAYPGIQVGSVRSICRIRDLTEDSGKGLTDVLVNRALEKFPPGLGPTHCFMTQRSLRQLQSSRTATTPTGSPAPWPTSIVGVDGQMIPIHVTGALTNTETLDVTS